jgi:hypothetical protein
MAQRCGFFVCSGIAAIAAIVYRSLSSAAETNIQRLATPPLSEHELPFLFVATHFVQVPTHLIEIAWLVCLTVPTSDPPRSRTARSSGVPSAVSRDSRYMLFGQKGEKSK